MIVFICPSIDRLSSSLLSMKFEENEENIQLKENKKIDLTTSKREREELGRNKAKKKEKSLS